jgi:cephalosporin hydroxylase
VCNDAVLPFDDLRTEIVIDVFDQVERSSARINATSDIDHTHELVLAKLDLDLL